MYVVGTKFTLNIGTSQLLTILILKFQQVYYTYPKISTSLFYYLLTCLKIDRWVANSVIPDQLQHFTASDQSGSTLFAQIGWMGWCLMAQSNLLRSCRASQFT